MGIVLRSCWQWLVCVRVTFKSSAASATTGTRHRWTLKANESVSKAGCPVLAASLLILTLAACATPTTGTDASKVASAIGHVKPSKQDTCETQKQVAAQSSRIDKNTIVKNKEVVYKADCATEGLSMPIRDDSAGNYGTGIAQIFRG